MKTKKFYLLMVMSVAFLACNNDKVAVKKKVIRPVKVKIIATGPGALEINTLSAVARGIHESILSFRVPGVLQTLQVSVGEQVKAGQIVATIDDRDYALRVDDLESKLKAAQAQLEQLQKGVRPEDLRIIDNKINALQSSAKTVQCEYQRVQKLYAADAASKSQLDQAKTQLDQIQAELKATQEERVKATTGGREEEVRAAKANLNSMGSNLAQVEANLEDTRLKIPFNGIISQKFVDNFQQIDAGAPVYTLVDIQQIELQISVPEQMINAISSGQKVKVEFLNFSDKNFSGEITKVGVVADSQTLSYPVFVKVANSKRVILPGMTANVILKSSKKGQAWPLIPIHAVLEDKVSNARFVWVYDQVSTSVQRRKITLGRIQNQEIEVFKGLKNGEMVIVAGVHRVKQGMKVRLP